MNMLTKLKQWRCRHEVCIDEIHRPHGNGVIAKCRLCNKTLKAMYGLELPAKIVPKNVKTVQIKKHSWMDSMKRLSNLLDETLEIFIKILMVVAAIFFLVTLIALAIHELTSV